MTSSYIFAESSSTSTGISRRTVYSRTRSASRVYCFSLVPTVALTGWWLRDLVRGERDDIRNELRVVRLQLVQVGQRQLTAHDAHILRHRQHAATLLLAEIVPSWKTTAAWSSVARCQSPALTHIVVALLLLLLLLLGKDYRLHPSVPRPADGLSEGRWEINSRLTGDFPSALGARRRFVHDAMHHAPYPAQARRTATSSAKQASTPSAQPRVGLFLGRRETLLLLLLLHARYFKRRVMHRSGRTLVGRRARRGGGEERLYFDPLAWHTTRATRRAARLSLLCTGTRARDDDDDNDDGE